MTKERCQRCGCSRLDHGADGGRCRNCGKRCNAFDGGPSKARSGVRRRQRRVRVSDRTARIVREIDEGLRALEARVEQLENHPAGCSCTRCTG